MSIGQVRPFAPDQDPSQSVAVTTTSTAVQINRRSDVVRIVTDGVIYVRIDNKPGVTATASDLKLTAGTHVLTKGSNEYIALIADTTATAHIATGDGALSSAVQGSGGGGGGGGDASAANQLATQGSATPGTAAIKSTLVGARYVASPASMTDLQQQSLLTNQVGSLAVTIRSSSNTAGLDVIGTVADGASGAGGKVQAVSLLYGYNGASYDRLRGDTVGLRTTPSTSAGTDRSVTVPAAGIQVMAANTSRRGLVIQNASTVDIWYSFGALGTAVAGAGNFVLYAGQSVSFMNGHVPSESIFAITATATTAAISAREW